MRGGVGHPAPSARGTETAALAREGDDAIETTGVAVNAQESVGKDSAAQEGAKLARDEAGHASCRAKEDLFVLHLLAGTRDAVARARCVRHPEFTGCVMLGRRQLFRRDRQK